MQNIIAVSKGCWLNFDMLLRFRRYLSRFFGKLYKIDRKPISIGGLLAIVLLDLFLLFHVFTGVEEAGYRLLTPDQEYPCHSAWTLYQGRTADVERIGDVDYFFVEEAAADNSHSFSSQPYSKISAQNLGSVSKECLYYESVRDAVASNNSRGLKAKIDETDAEIRVLFGAVFQAQDENRQDYQQQPKEETTEEMAARTRQEVSNRIAHKEELESDLLAQLESQSYIALLNNDALFAQVEEGYKRATLWYPRIRPLFQSLCLFLMLSVLTGLHRYAQHRRYGVLALLSWHWLIVCFIPFAWRFSEFLIRLSDSSNVSV